MPFPWHLVGGGLTIAAGLALAGLVVNGTPAPIAIAELSGYLAPALAWLTTTIACSLGLAWAALRLANR